jgi:hypothetical protein
MLSQPPFQHETVLLKNRDVFRPDVVCFSENAIQGQLSERHVLHQMKKRGEIFAVLLRISSAFRLKQKRKLCPPVLPIDIGQSPIPNAMTVSEEAKEYHRGFEIREARDDVVLVIRYLMLISENGILSQDVSLFISPCLYFVDILFTQRGNGISVSSKLIPLQHLIDTHDHLWC